MTAGYSTTHRNARLDALTSALGNACLIRFYDGTRPSTGGAAAGTLTGTAAWTNGGDTWVGVGKETLSGAGAFTTGNDAWAGVGKETLSGAGAFTAGNDAWVGVGDTGSGGGGGTQNTYAPTNVHPRANLPVRLVGYEHVPAGVKRAGIIGTKTRKTE